MRARLAAIGKLLVLVAVVVAIGWLSDRHRVDIDLSREQRAELSEASRATLARLDGAVVVTSYAGAASATRAPIAAFIARYQRHKPDVTLTFVDPELDPAAMRTRGISVDGEIEITWNGRSQRLTELDERTFTNALARMTRDSSRRVTFITGHGERRSDGEANADLGRFAAGLIEGGVAVERINLAAQAAIPDNAGVVVVASPALPYSDAESAQLGDWIARGGALLWLTEPAATDGLDPLLRALGLARLEGRLVDATGQGLGLGDPSFVALTHYPEHPIVAGFDLTTLFPQAAALAQLPDAPFAASPILRSSERSWTEAGAVTGAIAFDADSAEFPGPLDLGLALARLSPGPDRVEQRVVVIGDGDFVSNQFLGNGGNRAFGTRVIDWLLADDGLIQIPEITVPDRAFTLGPRAQGWFGVVLLIVIPLALALSGAVLVWRRRRR